MTIERGDGRGTVHKVQTILRHFEEPQVGIPFKFIAFGAVVLSGVEELGVIELVIGTKGLSFAALIHVSQRAPIVAEEGIMIVHRRGVSIGLQLMSRGGREGITRLTTREREKGREGGITLPSQSIIVLIVLGFSATNALRLNPP